MAAVQVRVIFTVFGVLLCGALLNLHFFQSPGRGRFIAQSSDLALAAKLVDGGGKGYIGATKNSRPGEWGARLRRVGRDDSQSGIGALARRDVDRSQRGKAASESTVNSTVNSTVKSTAKPMAMPLVKVLRESVGRATPKDSRAAPKPGGLKVLKLVRAVQRELTSRGYEPGPVDGVEGLKTKAAIMAFQVDQRILVSGRSSEALLRRIVLGGSAGSGSETNSHGDIENRRQVILTVQSLLKKRGYSPGSRNGLMTATTRDAIKAFERYSGLVPTGRVSGRLIGKLSYTPEIIVGSSIRRRPVKFHNR